MMIKKLLFFFAALTLTPAVQAQNETQEHWWGYVTEDTQKMGIGVTSADTYHCAIFIPGDHAVAAGKTIKAIRFGLTSLNATDAKVWIAANRPSSINANTTLRLVDVPDKKLGKESIDISLSEPYTIPSTGVYVGYSFTITSITDENDSYPVLVTGSDAPNALLLKTDQAVPNWQDLNGQGFGCLFLQVLLEGQFEGYAATASDFGPVYTVLGQSATADISILNAGNTPISDIDYTITTDGVTSEEQHAVALPTIPFNKTGVVNINVPADAVPGAKAKTLNITKVNGVANTKADKAAKFTLYTLPELVDRNVVVEEFTGTGCGWCPRGLIGMEKLRKAYGDRFVGIGLHQYNSSDAMYIASGNYAKINFTGAPSCRINRGDELDPYYGSSSSILNDFAAEMEKPSLAKVSVSGIIDSAMTKVDAKAEVEALLDNSNYTLEFVVIGDSLIGTGSAWNQANYYSQYTSSQLPADLAIFGKGGSYGKSTITGWIFNDVALCSSYQSGSNKAPALGTLAAGEKKAIELTLKLPTKTVLKNAMKSENLYVIALVVDNNKKIINAAKTKIELETAEMTGIDTLGTSASNIESYYTLDGKRLSVPQKGMNIVRMSNGSTKKIVIK